MEDDLSAVSVAANNDVRTDKDLERQRFDKTNQKELVNTLVFPVAMYSCESWTMKKERNEED